MVRVERSYSQDIERYAVKVKYKLTGSGVLVKVNESTVYLITAKHNFKERSSDTYKSVKLDKLKNELHEIFITKEREDNICKIKDIVYEESALDLIVFSVTIDSSYIKNLPTLNILKDDYPLKEYFAYGYPTDKSGTSIEELKRPSYLETKEHIFRLKGHKGEKETSLKGFSGSGLFTEYDNIIYLIGIIIKVDDKLFHYECIDLSKIINSINNKLNTPIEIKEDIIDVGFSQNIYTRILNRNQDSYLVKRILDELKGEKKLAFLKDNDSKREEIINFLDMDGSQLLKLEKELADLYLLKAIIYHLDGKGKHTEYFNKAKKFNFRYKNYQNELEKLNTIEEIDEIENSEFTKLQKSKLYFLEEKYDKVIEILQEDYIDTLDILEKIESYEYLAKSYEKKDSFEIEDSIGYWSKIGGLLDETQILENSEIYYELSLLYEKLNDIGEALNQVEDGSKLLEKEISNSFLEIKYKLEKQKKKLLGSNTIGIPNMTLTELFKQNPEKYMDEYLESLNSIDIEVTNKDILEEIKVLQEQMKDKEKKDKPL